MKTQRKDRIRKTTQQVTDSTPPIGFTELMKKVEELYQLVYKVPLPTYQENIAQLSERIANLEKMVEKLHIIAKTNINKTTLEKRLDLLAQTVNNLPPLVKNKVYLADKKKTEDGIKQLQQDWVKISMSIRAKTS